MAAIVFVLMGITFGSVVIAVKAVVSIALTLSLVYGIVTASKSLSHRHLVKPEDPDGVPQEGGLQRGPQHTLPLPSRVDGKLSLSAVHANARTLT